MNTFVEKAPSASRAALPSPLVLGYEVVIGFETHAQLSTQSKIFSRASTAFGAEPNTQACAVDLALPGTLPVMNVGAVERAIQFALAIGAEVSPRSIFARKNYFYPDLPKGYQISQFEIPVVVGGDVEFFLDGEKRSVRLVRAHLEEDAGKSIHGEGLYSVAGQAMADFATADFAPSDTNFDLASMSGIDLNRAGTPLLEIVTEPDMRSSLEAVAYAKELHKIVTWIGICDGNMQEGSFRCDANVSVRRPGAPLGTRREVKNLNSFKFMQQAIDYEVRWQIEQIEDGHAIEQATVLFDPDTGETRAMRSKEDAADYRYFPDPDLPPLVIADGWVQRVRAGMTELPRVMAQRFQQSHLLFEQDATALTASKVLAAYFEATLEELRTMPGVPTLTQTIDLTYGKSVANWVINTVNAYLNRSELSAEAALVKPKQLAEIVVRIVKNEISNNAAKQVFDALWNGEGEDVDALIEAKGLKQMNDSGALEKIVDEVLAANPKNIEQYKAGNAKALNALVGQIMKGSQGKANPQQVNDLLRQKLD